MFRSHLTWMTAITSIQWAVVAVWEGNTHKHTSFLRSFYSSSSVSQLRQWFFLSPVFLITWQDHIRNSEVAARTGLGLVSDLITRRRNSVFSHIAGLSEDTPAYRAHRCHVDLTLGHLPDQSWKRRPGCPNNRWIDQLRRDNINTPPADLWRRSTTRGHSGVTLRHVDDELFLYWASSWDRLKLFLK